MQRTKLKPEESKVNPEKTERIKEFPYVYTKKTELYGKRCIPISECKYSYMGKDLSVMFENGLKKVVARSTIKNDNTGSVERGMKNKFFTKEEVIEKILSLSKRPEGIRKRNIFRAFSNSNHTNKSLHIAIKEAKVLGMVTVPNQFCSKLLTLYKYQNS